MKKRDSKLAVPFPKQETTSFDTPVQIDGPATFPEPSSLWAQVDADPFEDILKLLFFGLAGVPVSYDGPGEWGYEISLGMVMDERPDEEYDIVIVGRVQHLSVSLLPIREKGVSMKSYLAHGHRCARGDCFTYWSHNVDPDDTFESYAEAHLCPTCGTDQRDVYLGPWAIPEKP